MGRWTPEMELLAGIIGCQGNDRVTRAMRDKLAAAIERFAHVVGGYPAEWRTLIEACRDWIEFEAGSDTAPPISVKRLLIAAFEASQAREAAETRPAADCTPAPHFAWQDRADIGDGPDASG